MAGKESFGKGVFDESKGIFSDDGGLVTLTGQFDMNRAGIGCVLQRFKDMDEVHLSLAERKVFVDTAVHVLDVNVPEAIVPLLDMIRKVAVVETMKVADVQS
ncbi:MAG: hypothetical protein AABZ47_17285 [Planctomycetota bacterium]